MYRAVFAFLLLGCALLGQADRPYTKTLFLDNALDFGVWGEKQFCDNGSFAMDIEIAFEDYSLLDVDETACNTVKLYCAKPDGYHTNYITSTVGEKGTWKGMKSCPATLMTGMRGRVKPDQGLIGDDEALQNVEMECDHGQSTVLAMPEDNSTLSDWSSWSTCGRGNAICGIQVRYQAPHAVEDDVAISDMSLYCCSTKESTQGDE